MKTTVWSAILTSVLSAGCSVEGPDHSSTLADDPNIKMFVALGSPTDTGTHLYVSVPSDIDKVYVCATNDSATCKAVETIAKETSLNDQVASDNNAIKVFQSKDALALSANQTWTAIAIKGDARVASVQIKVNAAGSSGNTDSASGTDPGNFSKGDGGEKGLKEVGYTDTAGTRSTYKINAPEDASLTKAYGLHIHLHGDGGGGYRDFPNRKLTHDLIGVTVKAPNPNLQWGRSVGRQHAKYVNELIQNELIKKYNIDLDRIYFSGVSGGAYFLTGSFIPEYGHNYNSGAYIMCGGERPRVQFAKPETLVKFRVYWQVTAGERADIRSNISQSTAAYKRALDGYLTQNPIDGFDPKSVQEIEIEGNGGHCEFDGLDYTRGIQSMMDRRFNVVLKD